MKYRVFKCIIILVLSVFQNGLVSAQNSFSLRFESPLYEWAGSVIENSNNWVVIIGGEAHPETGHMEGKLWAALSNTDTLTRTYALHDTTIIFNHIEERSNGNYLVVGSVSYPPDYNIGDLITFELDAEFNMVSKSIIHVIDDIDYSIRFTKHYGYNYYIFGNGDINGYNLPLGIKLDEELNLVDYEIFWDFLIAPDLGFMDCIISPDSTQLWLFTNGMTSIQGATNEIMVCDTGFNIISRKKFPDHISGYVHDVQYGQYVSAKLITDSTFLIGCNHKVVDFHIPPTSERDMGISELDTTMALVPIVYIGAADTVDYSAYMRCIDFIDSNRIFYAGLKNSISAFFPQSYSYVIAGMMNRQFQKIYEYYYGGDAHYITANVIAASDGGSIITAMRYDYMTQDHEFDLYLLKLNHEGLITNTNYNSYFTNSKYKITPNPARECLYVDSQNNAKLRIFDIMGNRLAEQDVKIGKNTFRLPDGHEGLLIISLIDEKGNSECFKAIKLAAYSPGR